MNKSEFTWTVIRISGLVLVIVGFHNLIKNSEVRFYTSGSRFDWDLWAVSTITLGLYLLLFGQLLHALLMRESSLLKSWSYLSYDSGDELSEANTKPARQQEARDPLTTLTPQEELDFAAWLSLHGEFTDRDAEDQIALFRDSQVD